MSRFHLSSFVVVCYRIFVHRSLKLSIIDEEDRFSFNNNQKKLRNFRGYFFFSKFSVWFDERVEKGKKNIIKTCGKNKSSFGMMSCGEREREKRKSRSIIEIDIQGMSVCFDGEVYRRALGVSGIPSIVFFFFFFYLHALSLLCERTRNVGLGILRIHSLHLILIFFDLSLSLSRLLRWLKNPSYVEYCRLLGGSEWEIKRREKKNEIKRNLK